MPASSESEELAAMRDTHPDWIFNRADTHVILGVPDSLDAFKTPVEPGNAFSPGPGSYGVSVWLRVDGVLYAPERMPLEALEWRFDSPRTPVLVSSFDAGGLRVTTRLFTTGDVDACDVWDHLSVDVGNPGADRRSASLYVVLRSFGAAGGPITRLAWHDGAVAINGALAVYPAVAPDAFGALSYAETGNDVSVLLERGELPVANEVHDPSSWASGALEYRLDVAGGQSRRHDFAFHLHSGHWMLKDVLAARSPLPFEDARRKLDQEWKDAVAIDLDVPDQRFLQAFYAQLLHLYGFTVHSTPRITPVSYPMWWLRDGVYVVNALGKAGLSSWVERACRAVAPRDAFGGFGSEADGPGEAIWMLTEHYLMTCDEQYLRDVYPDIERKARLLCQMRHAERPVRVWAEYVIPKCLLEPNADILCLAAKDGLIQGRMDHHFPIFWVNGFAVLGLRRAVMAARALGLDGSEFEREAEELRAALRREAEQSFGKNDRDIGSALWPTGWADAADPLIAARFDDYWQRVRCPSGVHKPELEWTYFEAGQAHNHLLLGHRDRAWRSIEWFLTQHAAPGLYTYPEATDGNSSFLWRRTRGWDDVVQVTPHGWTAAELFLLLRDCLVREERDRLLIGCGVPETWLSKPWSVRGLPTHFGRIDVEYAPDQRVVSVALPSSPPGGVVARLPIDVRVEVRTSVH